MCDEQIAVQLQHGLDEHAQGQVDQFEFARREPTLEVDVEEFVREIYVVAAVGGVPGDCVGGEVLAPHAHGMHHLVALGTDGFALSLYGQTVRLIMREQGA